MTIYHFEFGKLGRGLSGGENCLIQLIKSFCDLDINNVLLTTDNARAEYESLGLYESERLKYRTIASEWTEKWFGFFGSYVVRTLKALNLVRTVIPNDGDILLCNSDFFPNSIPFYWLSGHYPETRLVYWLRMLAPNIFRGYEGHYTGLLRFPSLRFLHYKLSQELYLKLIRLRGGVFVQNADFLLRLKKRKPMLRVIALSRYPGAPVLHFNPMRIRKQYDLAWMGRFHAQKGLFELVDILKNLKTDKPDISLLLMGGGNKKIQQAFLSQCEYAGVRQNVHFEGYANTDRFDLLVQARLFLLTSYYEGSPNVAIEALACGLPVVCYDLPIYSMFTDVAIKIAPLDNIGMAQAVQSLLNDSVRLSAEVEKSLQFSKSFTWRGVADEILMECG